MLSLGAKSGKKVFTNFRKKCQNFQNFMEISNDLLKKMFFLKVPQIRSRSSNFENFDTWVDSPDSEVSIDMKILSWTHKTDELNVIIFTAKRK